MSVVSTSFDRDKFVACDKALGFGVWGFFGGGGGKGARACSQAMSTSFDRDKIVACSMIQVRKERRHEC